MVIKHVEEAHNHIAAQEFESQNRMYDTGENKRAIKRRKFNLKSISWKHAWGFQCH
jgi:hypothetical protein